MVMRASDPVGDGITLKDYLIEKLDQIEKQVAGVDVKVTATNGRVKSLELWRAWLTGAVVVLGAVVGANGVLDAITSAVK